MSEYIECRNCDSPYCNGCNVYTLSKMLHKGAFKRITDDHHSIIPVAEVEAVKHGRWEWDGKHYYCSVCAGTRFHDLVLGMDAAYCSYCGAKMDGGKENADD